MAEIVEVWRVRDIHDVEEYTSAVNPSCIQRRAE